MAEHGDGDLRQGAKAAAAAAAVGAAVGVARAIASRAEEAAHRDDENGRDSERALPQEPEPVQEDERPEEQQDEPEREPVRGAGVERLRGLVESAREVLEELSGAEVESVSGVDRTRDGWRITVETVEVRRIPDSTDVLATYVVELDDDGDLVRYDRERRYSRAQSDRGDER